MMDSIKEVLAGLVLIPLSFGVVIYAASRSQASEELKGAFPITETVKAQEKKKAVFATGKIEAKELGDSPYVKAGRYLSLERTSEVYAWTEVVEEKESKKKKKKKKKKYKCELAWTSNPSKDFGRKGCRGKKKYRLYAGSKSRKTKIGVVANNNTYSVPKEATNHGFDGIQLTKEDLDQDGLFLDGNKLYFDKDCVGSNEKGCQRFSYSGSSYRLDDQYTLIGSESGGKFKEYKGHVVIGKGDYKAALGHVASDDAMMSWILFAISVLCLGAGLSALVGPLLSLIEYIPFIGDFGANLIRAVFMGISFVVMGITYLVIDYWYLVALLFIVGVIFMIFQAKGKKKAAAK